MKKWVDENFNNELRRTSLVLHGDKGTENIEGGDYSSIAVY